MLFESKEFGIEAWVETLTDKRRFAEHRESSHEDQGRDGIRNCYLECEEGKSFNIRFRSTKRQPLYPDIDIHVEIDGRRVSGRAWTSNQTDTSLSRMYVKEDGVSKIADLAFASLPKTDEEGEVQVRGHAIDRLGKISVTMKKGRFVQSVRDRRMDKDLVTQASVGTVHEKQLKLGSTVQAANVRPIGTRGKSMKFIPAPTEPDVCRFIWNYHSKTQLGLMGIIDDPPAPQAVVVPAVHTPSASAGPTALSVKREQGDAAVAGPGEGSKRVKREKIAAGPENKPIIIVDMIRVPRGSGVIDLTED